MRPIAEIWKWVLEGFTYRIGDFLIAISVTFITSYYFTTNFWESVDISSGASLAENALNTAWYLVNRALWHKVPEKDFISRRTAYLLMPRTLDHSIP